MAFFFKYRFVQILHMSKKNKNYITTAIFLTCNLKFKNKYKCISLQEYMYLNLKGGVTCAGEGPDEREQKDQLHRVVQVRSAVLFYRVLLF